MHPERFHRLRAVLNRRQPDLTVLMQRVNKPHNFSAILRNCDAVGVLEAHAVPPKGGLPLHQEASAGTAKWIPVHRHEDGVSAIRHLQTQGHRVIAAHPAKGAEDFRTVDYTGPTAILMGAELMGVSEEASEAADLAVRIPMTGMARSLNVSVATALILYEALRQREEAGMYNAPQLDADTRTRLLFEWAYPRIARLLRRSAEHYPELDDEGRILGSLDGLRRGRSQGSIR